MHRLILDKFIQWKDTEDYSPILLYGARQIGKTFVVNEFAQRYYPNNHLYINFFKEPELVELLDKITKPKKIIEILENYFQIKLDNGYLIIFDEVQEVPSIKTVLKLFVDDNMKYKIIATGSYLANTLDQKDKTFPVGKVYLWDMYPMNFEEYLMAKKKEEYIKAIKYSIEHLTPLKKEDHLVLVSLLKEFLYVGGMPEVVNAFINGIKGTELDDIKRKIYLGYKFDITKYINGVVAKRQCLSIYDSLNKFLARKHNRFVLSNLDSNARYLNFANSIDNILMSRIVYKVNNVKHLSSPLYAIEEPNIFKLYFNDCGLLTFAFNLFYENIESKENKYTNQRGALAENFVFSEIFNHLVNYYNPHFYTFKGSDEKDVSSNKNYEVDLIMEDQKGGIVPIEIKLGTTFTTTSLNQVMNNKNVSYGMIISSNNLEVDKERKLIKLPLYCAGFMPIEKNHLLLVNDKINPFKK